MVDLISFFSKDKNICLKFKRRILCAIALLNITLHLRILNINDRVTANNPSIRNEMLENHSRDLLSIT